MDYFLIRCTYNHKKFFSVWYSGDTDGFCCIDKKILTFPNIENINQYLLSKDISLKDESIATYNFDKLENWLNSNDYKVSCDKMLNFWNIFTDAATATELAYIGDKRTKGISLLYDKLFFGCNSRVSKWLLNTEKDYIPVWSNKQIRLLKSILGNGLNLFINNLTTYT